MSADSTSRHASHTVALLGNPNTGKSTVFNALTGVHQQTGNYPGVTVEKRIGQFVVNDREIEIVDLPGTYSLSANSPDEKVAVDVLLGRRAVHSKDGASPPDLIVAVVDASNLRRNLFLISQLLELQLPLIVALNMTDVAAASGKQVDVDQLKTALGVEVISVQANKRIGIDALKHGVESALETRQAPTIRPVFPANISFAIEQQEKTQFDTNPFSRFLATRRLFDEGLHEQFVEQHGPAAEMESRLRYQWIDTALENCVTQGQQKRSPISDRVDRILTHPFWGLLIAAVVMLLLFQAVFYIADPGSQLIDWVKGLIAGQIESWLPSGAFQSLLVNGVLEGVGGVLVFLPQILLLFLFLALLEDSGYLARAAFLMDRFLSRLGLNGSSLIPLLSSFACAIPGIMATRVIRDPRDRLITMLVAPLMTCSARLPVYVLLIAAFVPKYQGLVMFALYMLGIVTAILVAWVLKKTILRGQSQAFIMEMPTYKMPVLRNVLRRVFDGGWSFVRDAGTIIFAVTIVVWAAAYFPRSESAIDPALIASRGELESQLNISDLTGSQTAETKAVQEKLAGVQNSISAAHLENSFLGRGGKLIEPVVKPLGWDWRIGSAVIASFPAREVIVSTLGVIFGLGDDVDEESGSLRDSLKNAKWAGTDRPLITLPVALSIMVFFALCAQCVSTLAVMKRETNSWRWPIFTFVYMTVLAYIAAFLTFQIGRLIVG